MYVGGPGGGNYFNFSQIGGIFSKYQQRKGWIMDYTEIAFWFSWKVFVAIMLSGSVEEFYNKVTSSIKYWGGSDVMQITI
jgi:hypothetical protein